MYSWIRIEYIELYIKIYANQIYIYKKKINCFASDIYKNKIWIEDKNKINIFLLT